MPTTRYREDQLTPVTLTTAQVRRRFHDPAAGHRTEITGATSTDGQWEFHRFEDTGSTWTLRHLPTAFAPPFEAWGRLDDARASVVDGYVWYALWRDALTQLATREYPGPPGDDITGHDLARGYLTWAVENGHAQE